MSTGSWRGAGKKRLLGLACALTLLSLMSGAASGSATRPTAHGAALTPVTIATLPLEPAALAFYARGRRFFARQGIDAKLLVLTAPEQLTAALFAGEAQVAGFNVGGAAILKTRNAPVRVIAAGALYKPSAPASALVAAPGRTITRPSDLIGKQVAIDARNTIAHIALLKWLKRGGVSPDQVHVREIVFPLMLGPLRRGQVDAAVLPEPFLTQAVRNGARRVGRIFDAVCPQDCLLTVWMTKRDVNPTIAARFRNAIQAAAVWANRPGNDAASAAILSEYVSVSKPVLATMTRTRFAERLRPAQAQPWIDAYAEFGVIPRSFRAIDLVK
jgi:NitT/TauT family transport system substrate-binding protein